MNPVLSFIHSACFGPSLNPASPEDDGIVREPVNPGIASIRDQNVHGMRGAHRVPEHADLWQLGQRHPIVINKLLRHEHVSYCLAWKRRVNPHSRPISVLHTACGPDLSTVFLATNASRIIAVDGLIPIASELDKFFSHWHTIDTDPTISFDDARKIAMGWDKDPEAMLTMLLRPFKKMLEVRRVRGFWNDLDIMSSSVDRLTAIEVKKMGVSLNTIRLNSQNSQSDKGPPLGETQLTFDWAYPGEASQPRTVDYIRADIGSLFTGDLQVRIPPVDGLYQKARNGGGEEDRLLLRGVQSLLLAGGFVLMGGSSHDHAQAGGVQPPDALQELGPEYHEVAVDQIYNRLMGNSDPYGWRLYGSRRLG